MKKGDVNMGLKERSIDEYKKEQKLMKESNEKAAEIFADKAVYALQDIIGVRRVDIHTVDKQPCSASFLVDDLLFRVHTSEGYHVINMSRKCDVCGTDINTRIMGIKDIGEALIKPHDKFSCDQYLEEKERLERMKMERVRMENEDEKMFITDRRLLAALKDFILENRHMCSSI
jgi:hypothetical protein